MELFSADETPDEFGKPPARESRAYQHKKCGQITVVSGDDFASLTNPFHIVSGTMCVACQKAVGLREVVWAETGETILSYRRRMRRASPMGLKLLAWFIGPLALAALGVGIGTRVPPQKVSAPFSFGAIGFCMGFFLLPLLLSRLWGIDFRNRQ